MVNSTREEDKVAIIANEALINKFTKVMDWAYDASVKATTIHSFKGWETMTLVIYIDEKISRKSLALFYAGITRLKRRIEKSYLTIVSCSEILWEYSKTWPDYEEKIALQQ